MNELEKRLIAIQQKIHAPKSEFNKFGGFAYRNAEAIYQALKPLLREFECVLTLSDDIVLIGDRFYLKATATISRNGESISVSAFARESFDKKGMDSAQITGACSSYARKYALGGLFLIDDNKDFDSMDNSDNEPMPAKEIQPRGKLGAFALAKEIADCLKGAGLKNEDIRAYMQASGIKSNDIALLKYWLKNKEFKIKEAQDFMKNQVMSGEAVC